MWIKGKIWTGKKILSNFRPIKRFYRFKLASHCITPLLVQLYKYLAIHDIGRQSLRDRSPYLSTFISNREIYITACERRIDKDFGE